MKKKHIILIFGILVIILLVWSLFFFNKKEKVIETNTKEYSAYIKINPLVKLTFEEKCKDFICEKMVIIKYELLNEKAKDIYKDINFVGMLLDEAISILGNIAQENLINFKKMDIYTDYAHKEIFDINNVNWNIETSTVNKTDLKDISVKLIENNLQKYPVTFNSNGGSNVDIQEVIKGSKANIPSIPTKKDYVFIEWQLEGKKYDFNLPVENEILLEAIWEKPKTTAPTTTSKQTTITSQTITTKQTTTTQTTTTKKVEVPKVVDYTGKYNIDGGGGYIQLNSNKTCYYKYTGGIHPVSVDEYSCTYSIISCDPVTHACEVVCSNPTSCEKNKGFIKVESAENADYFTPLRDNVLGVCVGLDDNGNCDYVEFRK